MPITPGTFTPGDLITENAVRTELDKIKTWLNTSLRLTATDVLDGSVSKFNVHPPAVSGFPKENIEGEVQQVLEQVVALEDATPMPSLGASYSTVLAADAITGHFTIFLNNLLEGDKFIVMGKRFTLFGASHVEFSANFWASTTNDNSSADDVNAGNLRLNYREVGTTTTTTVPGSVRKLNPTSSGAVSGVTTDDHGQYDMIGMVESLAAGTYDVWLEYQLGSASTGLGQVTVVLPTIMIETHEQ